MSNFTFWSLFARLKRLMVQSSEAEANAVRDAAMEVTGSACCSKVSGSFESSLTVNLRMSWSAPAVMRKRPSGE